MPFGITDAPLAFQRLINSLFHGLLSAFVFALIDNIIIVSKKWSHMRKLEKDFTRLSTAVLTKCIALQRTIAEGVHTTDEKVKAVQSFPTPRNLITGR